MRSNLELVRKKSKKDIEHGVIIATREFPEEMKIVIGVIKQLGLKEDNSINGNMFEELKKVFTDKKQLNNGIKFAKYYEVNEVKVRGAEALVEKISYDEVAL